MTTNTKPENESNPETKTKGRPVGATWRYMENGKYNDRPLDPDYDKKYYHAKVKGEFKCPNCGCVLSSKSGLTRHQRTAVKCKEFEENLLRMELEKEKAEEKQKEKERDIIRLAELREKRKNQKLMLLELQKKEKELDKEMHIEKLIV